MATKSITVNLLRVLMILICVGWIAVWFVKPTTLWTRKWRQAEDKARTTAFGYYGLDFALYSFPVIALAMVGYVYVHLLTRQPRIRSSSTSVWDLPSNPIILSRILGVLSVFEILAISLFVVFLFWTFYVRISNDFKKLMPIKSLNLNMWELKYMMVATRFGLLAEACLALLFLPVLRGLSLFQIIRTQFEVSVRYHVWLGTAMVLFATVHGGSTLFIWAISHHIQDEMWRWQRTGRIYLAGEIALVTGLVMWVTSLPPIRRKKFEFFYYTHHLYIIFIVFFLFHVGDRHFYMVFGGIFLFGLDKLLRIIQSRPETCVLSAKIFPCKSIELTLPKDPSLKFTPASILFMKIPSLSQFQWHSFSITSSSSVDDRTVSLIIKCDGGWTSSLYHLIREELDSDKQTRYMPVAVEGPYGPPTMDFLRYDSLLLVAGGIGITPFLSILQEIASPKSRSSTNNKSYKIPSKVQLIYAVKSSQEISLLNSISSSLFLNQQSHGKCHLKLKIFVTREDRSNVTISEILNESSSVQTVGFDTQSSSYAIHGVETPLWMAALVGISTIVFFVFLVCLGNIFVGSQKKSINVAKLVVSSGKKSPESLSSSSEKTPSWVADLVILGSFLVGLAASGLMGMILRWRRMKRGNIPSVFSKESKVFETRGSIEEHEIHFGGRPNFEEILSTFPDETGGSNIGVLVCGPESMKESVASACRQMTRCFEMKSANRKKPYFSFHSLNFTL